MIFVYILKLKNKKYYVGKTTNPKFRIQTHFDKSGSAWTKKYKPLSIVEIISGCDDFDEDKYTLIYMGKYGINNVRGGSFCEIKLSKTNLAIIHKMLTGSMNKCYNCGSSDHFANKCTFSDSESDSDSDSDSDSEDEYKRIVCYKCGRDGHKSPDCYAKKDIDGNTL